MLSLKYNKLSTIDDITNHKEYSLNTIYYGILDYPIIHTGYAERVIEPQSEISYKRLSIPRDGGTIISQQGDFCFIGKVYIDFAKFGSKWIKFLAQELNRKYNIQISDNFTINHNDIIINYNGQMCKVGSYVSSLCSLSSTLCAGTISLTVNRDDIHQVCKKPSKKIPTGLKEIIPEITSEDIQQIFENFIKIYSPKASI